MFKLLSIIVLAMAAILGTMFHQLDKRLTKFEGVSGRALSSTENTERKNKRLKMRMGLVEDYLDTTTQVRILRELRKRIGGEASADLNSWLSGEPCDGEGDDWFGIECNENEEVKGINVGWINLDVPLEGKLPDSIGKLSSLEKLYLDGNELKGAIPESIGDLVQLTYLVLGQNKFKGNIPETIGNMVDLKHLSLQNNKLTGPIPEFIGNFEKLTVLYLNQNDLTGPIPASIGNLVNLQHLALNGNDDLTGSIPENLCTSIISISHSDGVTCPSQCPCTLED